MLYRLPINGSPVRYRSPVGGQSRQDVGQFAVSTALLSINSSIAGASLLAQASSAIAQFVAGDVRGPAFASVTTASVGLTAQTVAPGSYPCSTALLTMTALGVASPTRTAVATALLTAVAGGIKGVPRVDILRAQVFDIYSTESSSLSVEVFR